MTREKGLLGISANFEPQKAGPLDARFIVDEKADLTLTATWTANDGGVYAYKGMAVSVHSDTTTSSNGIYRLTDTDYTDINNWEQLGTGGGASLTYVDDTVLFEDGSQVEFENDELLELSYKDVVTVHMEDGTDVEWEDDSILTFETYDEV